MSVCIDTSAFLAVLNANDRFHARARQRWQQLIEASLSLICNNFVLIETIAVLQNRIGMEGFRRTHGNHLAIVKIETIIEEDVDDTDAVIFQIIYLHWSREGA